MSQAGSAHEHESLGVASICPEVYGFGGMRRPVQCDRFEGHDGQHEHLPLDLAWGPKEPGWTGTPQERGDA